MAQDFAPLFRSIWGDDDFRALTVDSQHAYLMLLSHPDRNSAGVLSLTKKKWTRLAVDLGAARLTAALDDLDAAGFIVLDEETEEVLVRSFVRRAKVYRHIRMMMNALREMSEVESGRLRSALGQELVRLPKLAIPEPTPRNAVAVAEAEQAQRQLDEVASTLCDAPPDPPGHGVAHPMGHGMPHPLPHPTVVVAGAVVVAGTGTALGSCSLAENESLESNARANRRLSAVDGKPARIGRKDTA